MIPEEATISTPPASTPLPPLFEAVESIRFIVAGPLLPNATKPDAELPLASLKDTVVLL